VRWGEVRWGEVRWGEVRWGEVRWGEVRRGEARWGEVRWDEVRCEVKPRRGKAKLGKMRQCEVRWGNVRLRKLTVGKNTLAYFERAFTTKKGSFVALTKCLKFWPFWPFLIVDHCRGNRQWRWHISNHFDNLQFFKDFLADTKRHFFGQTINGHKIQFMELTST